MHHPVMRRGLRAGSTALVAGLALLVASATAPPAGAVGLPVAQSTLVSSLPSTATPNITDGTVYAIAKVGSTVVAGGDFTTVADHGSSATTSRPYLLAFDATTGKVSTTFLPTLDGKVDALAAGPTAGTVYVGGFFTTVDGVRSKGVTLLDTQTGQIVSGFKPPVLNGAVTTLATVGGHLLVGGTFTTAGGAARGGLLSLDPATGKLDGYLQVQTAGHHNWNGTGAKGPVGPRAMAVSPDGTHMIVVGNFRTADGFARDQIVELDLGTASAVVDPNWSTLQFTAKCASNAFDTYVTDVQYAPDGSYFAVTATGGASNNNTDGTRSLCDAASAWSSSATGTNVQPLWVDYTGKDSLWSVAVTGTAVYVGGHQRWMNNYNGSDNAQEGAVPRPGIAALDPSSGMPLAWNPGRNPRGAGAYALLATDTGLYVGSDTNYIGNYQYERKKIAFFPLAGGVAPASTATATLPSDVYLAGPTAGQSGADDLDYRPMSTTQVGALATVPATGVAWSATRGAFAVGNTLFYGTSDGAFHEASFDGTHVGTPATVDPYDDPYWSTVKTGSKGGTQYYVGSKSSWYGEISSLTGAFFAGGRLYYTRANQPYLYWRWFSPDDGAVGSQEFTIPGSVFAQVSGIVASGTTLYYANSWTGALHSMSFVGGTPDTSTDQTVSTLDWRARSLFLYGPPSFPNTPPVASATATCTDLTCAFDGSASSDPDGSVASYQWSFGDGTTATGATPTHSYAAAGTYTVSLTVTDNGGATSTPWTTTVTASAPAVQIGWVGAASVNRSSADPAVTVPAGTQTGDTEIVVISSGKPGVTGAPGGAGWTQVAAQANPPLQTTVWTRPAPAGDAGAALDVPMSAVGQVDVELAVYRDAAVSTTATAADQSTQTHATPAIDTAAGGSWVLSYWAVRSSGTTTWTPPAAATVRATGLGSGGGHVDALLADSGGSVASGTHPALTADAGAVDGSGTTASLVLVPSAG